MGRNELLVVILRRRANLCSTNKLKSLGRPIFTKREIKLIMICKLNSYPIINNIFNNTFTKNSIFHLISDGNNVSLFICKSDRCTEAWRRRYVASFKVSFEWRLKRIFFEP